MPHTDVDDYNELKNALLKRYQLTEEGFRRKFREEKPDQGETVYQFIARIRRYLERWVDLAGIDKTYESVMDLLVREQYISTCSEEMAIFLKERIPKNVKEMTMFAERYVEAHERKYKSDDTDGQKSTTKAASAKQMETKSDNSAIERTQYRTRQCLYVGGTIILPETAFTGNVIGDIVATKEKQTMKADMQRRTMKVTP